MEGQVKDLLLCYMQAKYVTSRSLSDIDPCNHAAFLYKRSVYLGIKVQTYIETNKQISERSDLLDYFYGKCIDFMKTGCKEILNRYNFKDSVYDKIEFLLPHNAVSFAFHESFLTLLPALSYFNRFCDEHIWQQIDDEWRQLPHYPLDSLHANINDEIDAFWTALSSENSPFINLSNFALSVLSIPHSNAECERVFSKVNLLKTKTRNKLSTTTVNGSFVETDDE
ncbi:hypothetical protein ABEB36_010715 [Hypothenemus hampei]|uniref:HAT C-terminal dimerisation domain-containing protein n=1 Tax=Hypothenemus hampei TaxID=57062 RepID=A0ABD1ED57_HYPHA